MGAHQTQRSWTGLGLGLHSQCSILVQDHWHTGPEIWSPALLQRQGSQERRDPVARWKVLMWNISAQSLNSHCLLLPGGLTAFLAALLWLHSKGFLLSSFCLEDELCPQLYVHSSGACAILLWNPLCFCRLISAEEESYLCVKSSGDDTWQSLFSTPQSDGVRRQSVLN